MPFAPHSRLRNDPRTSMTDVEEAVPAAIDDKGLVQPDEALELDETIHSEEGSNSAGEVVAEKATKRRKKRQEQRHFSRRLVILTALLVLIMIGAVCGIVVVFLGGNDSDSDSDASTGVDSSPSTPPAPSTPVSTPTPSPVVSSSPPVESPTASPTNTALLNALLPLSGDRLDEPTSPQYRAYQWMATEDPLTTPTTSESELQQRYAMATMYFSLTGAETSSELPSFLSGLECFWPTAACGGHNVTTEESWRVTEFRGARQSFEGTIPPEIGLLESLVHLDLGDNMIKGSLPDEIYLLSNLKNLYLENNAMTGSLSESIGSLPLLENVYLAKNEFTGSIPGALRSRGEIIMPLRYLSLHHNQFTGTIPANLRLRKLFYMDLSFNQFSGTLPEDMGRKFVDLKALYLDHNNFVGSVPESFATIGNGRLYELHLNDNQFTGSVPPGWSKDGYLSTLNVQRNKFTETLDDAICKLYVFESGELVELGAECDICRCKTGCEKCY